MTETIVQHCYSVFTPLPGAAVLSLHTAVGTMHQWPLHLYYSLCTCTFYVKFYASGLFVWSTSKRLGKRYRDLLTTHATMTKPKLSGVLIPELKPNETTISKFEKVTTTKSINPLLKDTENKCHVLTNTCKLELFTMSFLL